LPLLLRDVFVMSIVTVEGEPLFWVEDPVAFFCVIFTTFRSSFGTTLVSRSGAGVGDPFFSVLFAPAATCAVPLSSSAASALRPRPLSFPSPGFFDGPFTFPACAVDPPNFPRDLRDKNHVAKVDRPFGQLTLYFFFYMVLLVGLSGRSPIRSPISLLPRDSAHPFHFRDGFCRRALTHVSRAMHLLRTSAARNFFTVPDLRAPEIRSS